MSSILPFAVSVAKLSLQEAEAELQQIAQRLAAAPSAYEKAMLTNRCALLSCRLEEDGLGQAA